MYQGCIFDLDGTLVNSLHSIAHTLNETLHHFGLGPVSDDKVKVFVGNGYQILIERSLQHCGDMELTHAQEAFVLYRQYFKEYCLYEIEAYEGIKKMLDGFKKENIKLAVLSNKLHDNVVLNVEKVFGKGYFDVVYGERPGVKIKPDPQGLELIMAELGLEPAQCLYFGDTNTDMLTGAAAGIDTVGVTWGFRERKELEECHPKYIIDHPSEIMDKVISSQSGQKQ